MGQERVAALLARQLAFYERAAPRYDQKGALDQLVYEVLGRLRGSVDLSGDVLEIACGAGQWTAQFAELSRSVTALDGAPAMLEFARHRLPVSGAGRVEFVCANVFGWRPERLYRGVLCVLAVARAPGPVRCVLGARGSLPGARRPGGVRGYRPR